MWLSEFKFLLFDDGPNESLFLTSIQSLEQRKFKYKIWFMVA